MPTMTMPHYSRLKPDCKKIADSLIKEGVIHIIHKKPKEYKPCSEHCSKKCMHECQG